MGFKVEEIEDFVKKIFITTEEINTRHETINKLFSKQLLSLPTTRLAMIRRR
jgi:hypothetical protein